MTSMAARHLRESASNRSKPAASGCRSFVVLLTAVGAILFSCAELWARAGGGGGYGGGGGSFGGGGGGGGGGFIYLLFWLCIRYPFIGIPLAICVVAFMYYGGRKTRDHHITRTIRRGRQRQAERLMRAGLQSIQAHDPAFEMGQLQQRITTAFEKIQVAWSEQSLGSVRAFISDGIHARFSLQLGMQKAAGFRNVMEDVQVHACEPVAIYSNDQFDTIHFRIRASARDYKVGLDSGNKISGSDHSGSFTEYWSFHRRPGAKSLAGAGAIEGNCPRCGAPLKIVDVAKCDSCGAQVNSGQFDWVLAEITQEQEWQVPGAESRLPGISELRQRDPGFNIQHIEDRVSVMFYRLRAAEFYHDGEYARPVVTPAYRDELQKSLERPRYYDDPVVGMVEMLAARSEGERDLLRVKIRWSGTWKERGDGSEKVLRDQTIYTQVFSLVRNHDAKTAPDETFSSAGCSNCGAPISVNQEGACVYCGTVLTNGDHDWVLDNVQRFTAVMAAERATRPTESENESEALFNRPADIQLPLAMLAEVMQLDGQFDQRERKALDKLGGHRGLAPDAIERVVKQASAANGRLPMPANRQQGLAYLDQLVYAVMADGQISRPEKQVLYKYSQHIGFSPVDVRMALKRERKRAYQQARLELRGKA